MKIDGFAARTEEEALAVFFAAILLADQLHDNSCLEYDKSTCTEYRDGEKTAEVCRTGKI